MNSYKFKTQPFAHQSTVLKECWDRENWALFLDMGTGKSKICIDNVAVLFQHDLIDTFVVVAPKGPSTCPTQSTGIWLSGPQPLIKIKSRRCLPFLSLQKASESSS